jgi:hypothetical protein
MLWRNMLLLASLEAVYREPSGDLRTATAAACRFLSTLENHGGIECEGHLPTPPSATWAETHGPRTVEACSRNGTGGLPVAGAGDYGGPYVMMASSLLASRVPRS